MSLVLTPLSLAMDPEHGVKCLRGKSLTEKWGAQYEKDAQKVLKEVMIRTKVVAKDTDKVANERADVAAQAAYKAVAYDALMKKCELKLLGSFSPTLLAEALKTAGLEQLPPEFAGNPRLLIDECHTALRQRKVDAVWRRADTVAGGTLQKEELERIADALGYAYDLDRVCRELGVEAPTTEEEMVTREQFAAGLLKEEIDRYGDPTGTPAVDVWFARLLLPLLPVEAGCLDFFCAC
jgi:hypothetical protein